MAQSRPGVMNLQPLAPGLSAQVRQGVTTLQPLAPGLSAQVRQGVPTLQPLAPATKVQVRQDVPTSQSHAQILSAPVPEQPSVLVRHVEMPDEKQPYPRSDPRSSVESEDIDFISPEDVEVWGDVQEFSSTPTFDARKPVSKEKTVASPLTYELLKRLMSLPVPPTGALKEFSATECRAPVGAYSSTQLTIQLTGLSKQKVEKPSKGKFVVGQKREFESTPDAKLAQRFLSALRKPENVCRFNDEYKAKYGSKIVRLPVQEGRSSRDVPNRDYQSRQQTSRYDERPSRPSPQIALSDGKMSWRSGPQSSQTSHGYGANESAGHRPRVGNGNGFGPNGRMRQQSNTDFLRSVSNQ